MEAVVKQARTMKQARTTKHHWLVACDATMNPQDFRKGLMTQKQAHVH